MNARLKNLLVKAYYPIQFLLLGMVLYNISFLFVFSIHDYTTKSLTEIVPSLLSDDTKQKYNIVVVTSYNLGENQQAHYSCMAAKNLGWDCYVLSFDERVINYNLPSYYMSLVKHLMNYYVKPDFVFYINPSLLIEEDAYTNYATLDVINYDILRYRETGNFDPSYLKWMSYFQGFLIFGEDRKWFENLRLELSKFYEVSDQQITEVFHPSTYQSNFIENAKNNLFYCGAIWDSRRGSTHYKDIYKELDRKDYFRVFGPRESWKFLKHSFREVIYNKPEEYIKKIKESGITLVFHHDLHFKHNIISQRIFEAATGSNVIISDPHPQVIEEFGDCVFYVNPEENVGAVIEKIDKVVKLMQTNSKLANQKAKCIYDIFINKFTIEKQLISLAKMHEKILQKKKWEFK